MKFNFFKSRKTLLNAILTSLLILTGLTNSASADEKKFKVVTTFTVIQDIAQNVAGDAAVVESITKVGAEIHEYDPTPQDITKALSADLVLWNGLNLELWFKRFFEDIKDVPSILRMFHQL
jgi:ABC-type metal ion transport system, periplasmic component/surface adhesin